MWSSLCWKCCDITASWRLPEHRVGCSEQGWSSARSLLPADHPAQTRPKRVLLPGCLAGGLQGTGPRHPGACAPCFPAHQRWKTPGGRPSAASLAQRSASSGPVDLWKYFRCWFLQSKRSKPQAVASCQHVNISYVHKQCLSLLGWTENVLFLYKSHQTLTSKGEKVTFSSKR